ncbi:hypothetical protein EYF80_049655 [Liparis tanakae]|uniref:Uncharacterized protein n=1 Tax=Liparis tanakae TaxID=230148 RepID=A0A4Z2FGW8_9TELE|nr:hypothetical protein EYF80_049655 [Liparis tanakae]
MIWTTLCSDGAEQVTLGALREVDGEPRDALRQKIRSESRLNGHPGSGSLSSAGALADPSPAPAPPPVALADM